MECMKTSKIPTKEEIEELAYRYWVEGGCPEGEDLDHWLRAEQDLSGMADAEEAPSTDLPE